MQWFSKSSATISYGTNLIIVAGFMFLVIKFQTTQIQLTWQVSLTDIRGDEGSFTIPIQFKVNDGVSFNRENISTLSNNNVTVTIPVNARTTVDVQT